MTAKQTLKTWMTIRQAAEVAIEAMDTAYNEMHESWSGGRFVSSYRVDEIKTARINLRAALAAPQEEPGMPPKEWLDEANRLLNVRERALIKLFNGHMCQKASADALDAIRAHLSNRIAAPTSDTVNQEPSDQQLNGMFEKNSVGPNPYVKCKVCEKTEPGVRSHLVDHWKTHAAPQAVAAQPVPSNPTRDEFDARFECLHHVADAGQMVEPVAWANPSLMACMVPDGDDHTTVMRFKTKRWDVPLYTHPADESALRAAAQAVLDQWNSERWKWHKLGPTADLMHALAAAIGVGDVNHEGKS